VSELKKSYLRERGQKFAVFGLLLAYFVTLVTPRFTTFLAHLTAVYDMI